MEKYYDILRGLAGKLDDVEGTVKDGVEAA